MGRFKRQRWRNWLAAAVVLATSGCGGSNAETTSAVTTTSTTAEATEAQQTSVDGQGSAAEAASESERDDSIELYFTSGEQFAKVERKAAASGDVEQAAQELIDGPTAADSSAKVEAQTQIPGDIALEQVVVDDEGTATVELSGGFTAGIPGDAEARSDREVMDLNARLGQITYTLTQFDEVDAVKVISGGETVEPAAKRAAPAVERADYAKPEKPPQRKLRPRGAKSADTRTIQKRLAKLRYLPRSAVDGIDGYRTQQAVIAFQSWRGLERDGVVGPATTAALARASRPKPKGGGPERRIEVHREKGVALLIAGGKVKRAIHVSTGAPGTDTPSGRYSVFRKELQSWSVPFSTWLPYASYFNQGIALHEYPDVPTFPASHGCVRVPAPEAKGVYEFATIGTAVEVI